MSVTLLSNEGDGVAVLACEGELNGLLMNNGDSTDLKPQLGEQWASQNVVLDMSEANYMDSAAVGWLLSLHRSFEESGGRMILCNIQPEIRRVIELMRIDRVVPIVDERAEAIAKLKQSGDADA